MQDSGLKSENPTLISIDDHVLCLIMLVWSPQGSDFFWFVLVFLIHLLLNVANLISIHLMYTHSLLAGILLCVWFLRRIHSIYLLTYSFLSLMFKIFQIFKEINNWLLQSSIFWLMLRVLSSFWRL